MSKDKYTVTVKEAAERLGVSKRTIYRKLNNNDLEGVKKRTKHGDKWYISEEEFKNQAEIVNEVVEIEEKVDLPELKGAMKEVFEQAIETAMTKEREKIKEEVRQEVKEEMQTEREELKKELKKELEVQKSWINARDERLINTIRKIQEKNEEKNKSFIEKIKDIFK